MLDIYIYTRPSRFVGRQKKNRPLLSENRILGIKIRNFAEGTIPLKRILMSRLLTRRIKF